jgi:DNA-directed RNA polymerase specialized sigma24 family protein
MIAPAELERAVRCARGRAWKQKLPSWIDREDYAQEVVLDVLRAAETYDPAKGAAWQSWAYRKASYALVEAARRLSPGRRGLFGGVQRQLAETEAGIRSFRRLPEQLKQALTPGGAMADSAEAMTLERLEREERDRLPVLIERIPDERARRLAVRHFLDGVAVCSLTQEIGLGRASLFALRAEVVDYLRFQIEAGACP